MSIGKCKLLLSAAAVGVLGLASTPHQADASVSCDRTITANVVALDQPIMFNRLGAQNVNGMVYALRRDVVDKTTGKAESEGGTLTAGNVKLREDKRPRPITLRMNVGDCLQIIFQNLLASSPVDDEQPATRSASVRVLGLQLVGDISSDGSFVGALRSTSASKHPPRRGASDNV